MLRAHDRVERGLLVLDLVQPADVGADPARAAVRARRRATGTESAYDVASAVIALVMPGPEVVMNTPGPAADPGVPVGGVPGALLVPGDHVPDAGGRQVAVELEVVGAGDAEHVADAVRDQRIDDGRAAGDRVSHGRLAAPAAIALISSYAACAAAMPVISAWSYAGATSTMSAPTRLSVGEGAQDVQQLPAGQAAGLRGAGAGREGRVEHVDVERDVRRPVAHARADPVDHPAPAEVVHVVRADDLEAEHLVVGEVLARVERAADADVHAAGLVDEAFLAARAGTACRG